MLDEHLCTSNSSSREPLVGIQGTLLVDTRAAVDICVSRVTPCVVTWSFQLCDESKCDALGAFSWGSARKLACCPRVKRERRIASCVRFRVVLPLPRQYKLSCLQPVCRE